MTPTKLRELEIKAVERKILNPKTSWNYKIFLAKKFNVDFDDKYDQGSLPPNPNDK